MTHLLEPLVVGRHVVQRSIVKFEVSGVNHITLWGLEEDTQTVDDVVVDVEKFDVKLTQLQLTVFVDCDELQLRFVAEVFVAFFDNTFGQFTRIDDGVTQLFHDV